MQPELTNLLTLERQSPLANGDCSVNLTLLDLTSMIIICLFNELRYFFSVPVFQKVVCVRGIKKHWLNSPHQADDPVHVHLKISFT